MGPVLVVVVDVVGDESLELVLVPDDGAVEGVLHPRASSLRIV